MAEDAASPIKVNCIEVQQPIGTFYIGAIEAPDLVAISFADVRRPEGREIEKYIGTQRDLSLGRVADIKKYVTTVDACFPTSVILSIPSSEAKLDDSKTVLEITRGANVAKIIDGQHRIAGLEDYSGSSFAVNVTIFLDMDLEDQAMVFATINLQQTKVTKSLAYDLYDFAKARSPQKTCHNIAKLMNFRDGSPFAGRIKILGKATGQTFELITQATFVDRLLRMITKDAMIDKDKLKRGKELTRATPSEERTLVFRNRFIDEKDAEIAKCLWNYFDAVRLRWPTAWNTDARGVILPRTTGFAALMRVCLTRCRA
ncbi:MAG TPA: DGQHR domain-containing protein [Chthoniobacterales bacterium]|jgi:DGQHR domain-containing protein|nr:DGQHR domain-containing protein [Chthoniobacterales bacterium]